MPSIPADTRATGTGNPAADMNSVADILQMLTGTAPGGTVPTGAGGSWNAAYWDPRAFGAVGDGVTDDTTAINACITATPALGGVVNLAGAPVSYAISSPIILKSGCTFMGSWVNAPSVTSHLDITTLASFSGLAALADAGALNAVNTTPTSSYPISVIGVSVDLTACTGTTTDAFRLMTYGAWVMHCMTKKAPACGLRFTDANAGGFSITNSAVENRVCDCSFTKSGLSGILVENHTAALTDGYCVNNIVQGRSIATGDAADATGAAFDFEYCSDWQIRGNHAYACAQDAYIIKNGFGTFFDGNDVDVFGTAGTASTTFHGVYLANQLAGPATLISNCDVQNDESHGAASTVYEYYHANGTTAQTGYVTMVGNCARQAVSGSGASRVRGFIGSGGTLNVTEVGTSVVLPATSPTLTATNSISGTVNLNHPGSTTLNSTAISIPVGVSNVYGAVTNVFTPLFAGASFAVNGIQIVWGGTFAGDTGGILITATFDDGSTGTYSSTATTTSTVNLQPAQLTGLYKQGRQPVLLTAQARDQTSGTTTITVTVLAMGVSA